MDTVLGVSITRIAAGLVLLEGRIPDVVTVDRDAVDLSGADASMTDVMAAVLGIQGSVSAEGHRLRAVGVTWSAGSEPKARELVTTLTEFGLTNIVTVRPAEAANKADVAAPDGEVPLARGAALALAGPPTAETEHDENPRRERRRPAPSSIAAATILCGGTLGVLAAMWILAAPRHTDTDVAPPAPQQSAPPATPSAPSRAGDRVAAPPTPTGAPQGAAPVNTPKPPTPAASRQPVPLGVQHLPQQLANPSAAPPPDGQDPPRTVRRPVQNRVPTSRAHRRETRPRPDRCWQLAGRFAGAGTPGRRGDTQYGSRDVFTWCLRPS